MNRASALDLVHDLLQSGRIVHGGQIARVAAFGHGLNGAAQQFAAARLGQGRHKEHTRWTGHRAQLRCPPPS